MPHTLAHLGTQGLLTRAVAPRAPLLWIYLGAVLPDLPWIAQRVLRPALAAAVPGFDAGELRLYAVAQASLLGCVLLAAAVAAVSERRRAAFALLASGALLHLLLDAVEAKWANGVVLLAPFDWSAPQLGWFWPESGVGLAWTLLGAVWVIVFWRQAWSEDPAISREPRRWLAAAGLALLWVALPLAMMPGARRADAHFVRTLQERDQRPGRSIELSRADAHQRPGLDVAETLQGEEVALLGLEVAGSQRISIRGRFVDERTIRVDEWFVHAPGLRDGASYLGLGATALLWLHALWAHRRGARRGSRAGSEDARALLS